MTIGPDAKPASQVCRASLVLVGADSVLKDGSVINGTPTLALAQAGRAAAIPVWVVCEAAKLDRWSDPGSLRLEPGFERVPAELVHALITGEGPADKGGSGVQRGRRPRSG